LVLKIVNEKFAVQNTWQRADVEQFFNYDQIGNTWITAGGVDFGEVGWALGEIAGDMLPIAVNVVHQIKDSFSFIEKSDNYLWIDSGYMHNGAHRDWSEQVIPTGNFDRWEAGHDFGGLLLGAALISIITKIVPVKSMAINFMGKRTAKLRHKELLAEFADLSHNMADFASVTAPEVPETELDDVVSHDMLEALVEAWAKNSRQPLREMLRGNTRANSSLR